MGAVVVARLESGRPDGAWLDAARTRSTALLVEGPAGIGKSHHVESVVAGADGWRVLRARPALAEMRLAGSALLDLCEDVTDAELAALPDALARPLGAALLRDTAGDRGAVPAAPEAVHRGFLTLLRSLAAQQPVLLVVDDLHWLDEQTAGVLAYALRRLPPAGVAVLAARRTGADVTPWTEELATHLGRQDAPLLGDVDLEEVLAAHLGPALPTSVVRRAIGAAGGNPLFALEVARVLLDQARGGPVVPLPASLAQVVGARVRALPAATRTALGTAAALTRPTLRQLRELGVADDLEPAEVADLVERVGPEIRFRHPLFASAAYDGLSGTARASVHARIAPLVDGLEEHARHLALGAEEPSEDVASALDRAREHALLRGALRAAVDDAELAVGCTPAGSPALAERRTSLGRLLFRTGDAVRARDELTRAADEAPTAVARARALLELARVLGDTESEVAATGVGARALQVLGDADPLLAAEIHVVLANFGTDDWAAARTHATTALEVLDALPDADTRVVAAALTALAATSFYAGQGADLEACQRAIDLEKDTSVAIADRALAVLFYLQLWTDDVDAARDNMRRCYDLTVEEGDEGSRAYVLSQLAQLELRAGRWDAADEHVRRCLDVAARSGNGYYELICRQVTGWLEAYRGSYATALARAAEDVTSPNPLREQRGRALRGFCALAAGDAAAAADDLQRWWQLFAANNAAEPALRQQLGDLLEALVADGRLDAAAAVIAETTAVAGPLGRTAVLAAAARGEALLLSARGDVDAAVAAAERSLALYATLERPFDRARTLLAKGQVHRRHKQKALARRELTAALECFESLGAQGFAARTREELARIGLRPAASLDLTETERRIAELTATGRTSAEIGASLYLSTKTVSGNLTRIYRKLGVRNRAELTAKLAVGD